MVRRGTTEPGTGATWSGATVIGIVLAGGLALLVYLALAWVWDWIFGGGIWSLFAAVGESGAGAQRIEVDRDALTMVMIVLVFAAGAVVVSAVGRLFPGANLDSIASPGTAGTVASLILVVLWFSFSSFLSETVEDRLMTARHYVRCPALAHHTGSGKSRTDFNIYLSRSADCPPSSS